MKDDGRSEGLALPDKASVSRSGWYWLGGLFLIVVASKLLGMLNRSTTLLPDRVDGIYMALMISLLAAGLSIVVGLNETRGPDWTKFTCGVLAFGTIGFLAPFMLLVEVSNLVFAKIDFPLENTRTFRAILPIGRAYESSRTRFSPTTQRTSHATHQTRTR